MLCSTFDLSFFWVSAPLLLKLFPQKMKRWLVATSSPLPLHLFPSASDGKYPPLAFFKDIPGLGITNSGLLSFGKAAPLQEHGQKTDAERLQQKWPHCSTNNLASKGSCEAQDIGQMHLTGLQDFLFKFSVTVRGIFSPPLSPHLTWTKKMS